MKRNYEWDVNPKNEPRKVNVLDFLILCIILMSLVCYQTSSKISRSKELLEQQVVDNTKSQPKAVHTSRITGNYDELASEESKSYKDLYDANAIVDIKKSKGTREYIKRFSKVAVAEMDKYGIPASIKLAQAILESNRGKSKLAKEGNAHFAIKCSEGYQCGSHKEGKFRYYDTAWLSWRDHSKFLQKERYKDLYTYGRDYKKWAHGLKRAGYAEDKDYASKLIRVIEFYELNKFDKIEVTFKSLRSNSKGLISL